MKIEEVGLSGLLLVVSDIYRDSRGFLYERYNEETSKKLKTTFVQQNISVSQKKVLRGMHWQYSPHEQGKLVTCLSGAITYLCW
jgi:dTDP-4-dehydrorhamnose 3,5-epimerase